jgi:YD repeat-containing protein
MTNRTVGGVTNVLNYNAENRLVSVTVGGSAGSFVYDGDGNRVKSFYPGMTTYYIGNYYEKTNGGVTKYYYAGGQRVAMRSNGTLSYILSDHLGSTSLTTDGVSGAVTSELRYTAWGEVRYQAGVTPTNYTYTGQYDNTGDFGLMYYNARFYDLR